MGIPVMQAPSSDMWMRAAGVGVPTTWDIFGDAIKNAANTYQEMKKYRDQMDLQNRKLAEDTRQFDVGMKQKQTEFGENVNMRKAVEEQNQQWKGLNFGLQSTKVQEQIKKDADAAKRANDSIDIQRKKLAMEASSHSKSEQEQNNEKISRGFIVDYLRTLKANPSAANTLKERWESAHPEATNTKAYADFIQKLSNIKGNQSQGKYTEQDKAKAEAYVADQWQKTKTPLDSKHKLEFDVAVKDYLVNGPKKTPEVIKPKNIFDLTNAMPTSQANQGQSPTDNRKFIEQANNEYNNVIKNKKGTQYENYPDTSIWDLIKAKYKKEYGITL